VQLSETKCTHHPVRAAEAFILHVVSPWVHRYPLCDECALLADTKGLCVLSLLIALEPVPAGDVGT
jgi:hypothetical protein